MSWTRGKSLEDCPDDALVSEARADPEAFARLYDRYHAPIHNFVLRKVNDPHRAEDITSQVFLRALRGLPTYGSGSFRGWLFQIARNTIVDSYRRNRPTVSDDALIGHADPALGPTELAEVQEAREQIYRLIDQLGDTQRDIIRMRLRGYSGQEIADELGMKLAAVKSAQFRAFGRIRTLMNESPDPPDFDGSPFQRPDR